ncbi:MAG: ABC transporter ATP-binding protein [Planctomycetota bacterium]
MSDASDAAPDPAAALDPLQPAEDAPPVSTRRLLGLARPYVRPIALVTVLLLLGSSIGLAVPWVAGRVVDLAIDGGAAARLDRVVLVLFGLFAALGLLGYAEHYLLRATGSRLLRDLRARLFSHLLDLPPAFFLDRPIGELLSRLGSDLTVMQSSLTTNIPAGIQALLRFLGTLVVLLVLQTKLTLVALGVIPPVVLVAMIYGQRLERLATREQDALAGASGKAEEALAGITTVQAFVREPRERQRYRDGLDALLSVQLRNANIGGAFSGLVTFAGFSAFALVLWYGGRLMLDGSLTPGELTSFLLYTSSIAVSVGTLAGLFAEYKELRGASARIFHLLDTQSEVRPPAEPVALDLPESTPAAVQFAAVTYRYAGQEVDAVQNVDVHVRPGETLGLVGPSGSGKSTLFNLLLRFADPTEGSVRLHGHDLRSLDLAALRQAIGVVPQEIFLLSGTIAENLRYGRPDASDDDVRAAAAAAGAAEFVERLPKGYDERIGQRGLRLSAGQRQRLAIARVLLKDPAVLLLDEATSSLDPDSEHHVQRALAELTRRRTTLVIAHRLVTARRADRIAVLEAGRVVGLGAHEELFASSALYRRYWELQSLADRGVEGV